jgi:hypothetical protein
MKGTACTSRSAARRSCWGGGGRSSLAASRAAVVTSTVSPASIAVGMVWVNMNWPRTRK